MDLAAPADLRHAGRRLATIACIARMGCGATNDQIARRFCHGQLLADAQHLRLKPVLSEHSDLSARPPAKTDDMGPVPNDDESIRDRTRTRGKAGMKTLICCLIATMLASSLTFAREPVTPGNRFVPADRVPWVGEGSAPVELGALWGDRSRGEAGTLLRTPAGFRAGLHSHTADYWAVVVQGVWEHWVPSTGEGTGIRLERGAHWSQVKTQLHEDACVSDEPCIIFLFNKKPYVTEYPSGGAQ